MAEYILVVYQDGASSDGRLISTLANAGWLVSAAASPLALRQCVAQHGPPALLICTTTEPQPAAAAHYAELRLRNRTRILHIVTAEQNPVANGVTQRYGFDQFSTDEVLAWPASSEEVIHCVRRLLPTHATSWQTGRKPWRLRLSLRSRMQTGLRTGAPDATGCDDRPLPIEHKILRQIKAEPYPASSNPHVAYYITTPALETDGHVVRLMRRILPS